MKKYVLFLAVFFCITIPSCDIIEDAINTGQGSAGTVYYWITSDADTYVQCNLGVGGCSGGDFDQSGFDGVVVGNSVLGIQRSYINFPKPVFPPGTVIEEAYFEMYHSGKNEDGKRDDILLEVHRVKTEWNAGTITYANQPIQTGSGGGEFNIKLESQNWSGTTNISGAMQQELVDPSTFQGFLIYISNFEPGYQKGFYSGNHKSRTINDLGFAPRLLLKVSLPDGYTTSDVTFGNAHSDGKGGMYFGFRFRTGLSWPAEWNLANVN